MLTLIIVTASIGILVFAIGVTIGFISRHAQTIVNVGMSLTYVGSVLAIGISLPLFIPLWASGTWVWWHSAIYMVPCLAFGWFVAFAVTDHMVDRLYALRYAQWFTDSWTAPHER